MKHYLTNVDASEIDKERVQKASIASGQDVRYEKGPMPPDAGNDWYCREYDKPNHGSLGELDCIVGYNAENGDYSKFWEEYQKLK